MLAAAAERAGLADLLDPLLSVHETRRFETDPASYALGPQEVGLRAAQILRHGWDAIGATWYGYTPLWVNRAALPLEQP
jgi:2-haloacid dehalogenase